MACSLRNTIVACQKIIMRFSLRRAISVAMLVGIWITGSARSVAVSSGSVTLAWTPSISTNVVSYNVYYGSASGIYSNVISVVGSTNATITGLVQGITYYFAARAVDSLGAESQFSGEIAYSTSPVQFTASPTNGVSQLTVQFDSPTVDSAGDAITNWLWNFGDSSTSTAQNPVHTYTSTGIYSPKLTVVNSFGIASPGFGPAITVTNPVTSFTATPTNGVSRLNVQFASPGTDSGGNGISSWNWSFGDGSTGVGENPAHIYTNSGTFYPALIATNVYGLSLTSSGPVIVVTNPVISFTATPTNGVSRLNVQFASPGTDSGGNGISSWNWSFGDGSRGTGENPLHIYTNSGTFYPALIATNVYGLSLTNSGPMIVVTNPVISFTATPTNGVSRLNVHFSAPATDSGGNSIKSWNWNFGDGSTGVGENPAHIYTNSGTFYPALIATNVYGLSLTNSGPVIVVTNPVISFTAMPTNGVSRLNVHFSAPATDSGGNSIKSWNWNFGDGSRGTGKNPRHYYTSVGTFYPVLIAINVHGVSSTSAGPVIVVTNPVIKFTATPTNSMPPLTVHFMSPTVDNGGNAIKSWIWNFGDGRMGSGENATHTYTNAGTYYPILIATNAYGLSPTSSGPAITVTRIVPDVTVKGLTTIVNSPPCLSITMSGANAILTWPTNANNCTLQCATNPTSMAAWTNVNCSPVIINGQNVVTNSPSAPWMFFRLKQE